MRAIIFDCFGVLVSESWNQFLGQQMADERQRREASDAQKGLDTGMLSEVEFVDRIAEIFGLSTPEVREALFGPARPDEVLFETIRDLKAQNYKIGLISNISSRKRLREVLTDEQIALFEVRTLSSEVGVVKPAPEIYELAATNLGVEAGECLFIDDVERNCEGARVVGMEAILFVGVADLRRELANYGILTS